MAPRKFPEPFRRKNAKVWYFCFWEGDKRIYKSTGETVKYKAVGYIKDFLDSKDARLKNITLKEYIEPFYDWDRCPHVRQLREENKSIQGENLLWRIYGQRSGVIFGKRLRNIFC